MKIWHISDTHTLHNQLLIPDGIDMVIHSGDCATIYDPILNKEEVTFFLEWFKNLPIKYKIFVGGNHDTSIEKRLITPGYISSLGIIYLENNSTCIEDINIWGTPVTPEFGVGWAWNRKRGSMDKLWKTIPENTDIVISHGPPKGILDLTITRENKLDLCGCSAMKKHMIRIKPKLCLFGHIHNCNDITNAGIMQIVGCRTIFSNATCVEDGRFDKGITSHGNILEI